MPPDDAAATRLHARFPSASFVSQAEFVEFRRTSQDRLDARHSYETTLPTRDDRLILPGTCAPCLRRARFVCDTTGWEQLPDGRRLPEWEDALVCDCADALGARARALVHFAQAHAALRPWTRLLLFGPPDASHRRLAALAGETIARSTLLPDVQSTSYRLDAPDEACHLAVAAACLHRVPPLDAALAALRRVLAPGGSLIFTVPFRHDATRTISRTDLPQPHGRLPALFREPVHEIGWDVLDRLRAAGFVHAAAHCYWSAELGYLGAFNMIFHAAV
jgi:SAM-dependent methyltransferase